MAVLSVGAVSAQAPAPVAVAAPVAAGEMPAPELPAFCLAFSVAVDPADLSAANAGAEAAAVVARRLKATATLASSFVRSGPGRGFAAGTARIADRDTVVRLATAAAAFGIYGVDDSGAPPAAADLRSLPMAGEPGTILIVATPPLFTGADIVAAAAARDPASRQPMVRITFDPGSARRFADATRTLVGQRLAIVFDGQVMSAPRIMEPILGGQAAITGLADFRAAGEMAVFLQSGFIPAPVELLAELPPADCIETAPDAVGPPAQPAPN